MLLLDFHWRRECPRTSIHFETRERTRKGAVNFSPSLPFLPGFQVTMNHTLDDKTPKFDVELDFEEIGFILDNHQYRDVISMVDMYHFFLRNQQVRTLKAHPMK